jgi:hypothetical protein
MRFAAMLALLACSLTLALSEVRAEEKGTKVKIGSLSATTPADWVKEKPANLLRSYQFKLPGEKDQPQPEVAVFPESHPNPDKSIPKWKTQFVPPEGKTTDDISKVTKWDLKGATVTVFDITGTWKYRDRPNDPKSKEMLLDDYRAIWVIVAEKEEATHIRLSGPAAGVAKNAKAFEEWIKSLK